MRIASIFFCLPPERYFFSHLPRVLLASTARKTRVSFQKRKREASGIIDSSAVAYLSQRGGPSLSGSITIFRLPAVDPYVFFAFSFFLVFSLYPLESNCRIYTHLGFSGPGVLLSTFKVYPIRWTIRIWDFRVQGYSSKHIRQLRSGE